MLAEQNTRHEEQSKGRIESGAAAKHILVVDDDPDVRDMLTNYLESENFRVSAVADSQAMSRVLNEKPVDLMILDMKLADEDGFDIMRQLGSPPEAPIIVITGHRRDEVDRVVGLELGADDYITKPFSLRELSARVRAALRRGRPDDQRSSPAPEVYRGKHLVADFDAVSVAVDGVQVRLTRREFELLKYLVENRNRVLSRNRLLERVWGYERMVETRSVDVHVGRLRAKLGMAGQQIETVVGLGYRFVE
jgi:two-component system, OmpR family, response regulator